MSSRLILVLIGKREGPKVKLPFVEVELGEPLDFLKNGLEVDAAVGALPVIAEPFESNSNCLNASKSYFVF